MHTTARWKDAEIRLREMAILKESQGIRGYLDLYRPLRSDDAIFSWQTLRYIVNLFESCHMKCIRQSDRVNSYS